MRNLDDDSCSVACQSVSASSAAVIHASQHLQPVADHLKTAVALEVCNESDTARIPLFNPRIVQQHFVEAVVAHGCTPQA
jgi:hypothetical protein